ncbi:MAG: Ldh family oxidoreductase, partial [Planctomycetota bacterium]
MPVITAEKLQAFAEALFVAGGAEAADAGIVATSLVDANLRGHDSHGVMRIPFYIAKVQEGALNAKGRLQIVHETPAVLVGDGEWGFGQVLAQDLMRRLIVKAGQIGMACGTLRR